jgi:hypothetical protein
VKYERFSKEDLIAALNYADERNYTLYKHNLDCYLMDTWDKRLTEILNKIRALSEKAVSAAKKDDWVTYCKCDTEQRRLSKKYDALCDAIKDE